MSSGSTRSPYSPHGIDGAPRPSRRDDVDERLDIRLSDADLDVDLAELVRLTDREVDDALERRLLFQREVEPLVGAVLQEHPPGRVEDLLFVEHVGEGVEGVSLSDQSAVLVDRLRVREHVP